MHYRSIRSLDVFFNNFKKFAFREKIIQYRYILHMTELHAIIYSEKQRTQILCGVLIKQIC